MSRSTESREHKAKRDGGFTLIEVVVALGIVMILIVAVLPLLISSIRSTEVVRGSLQEKGLTQTELERMRNLPYYVAPAAGDYVDVLDRYFPDLTPPQPALTPSCGNQSDGWTTPTEDWSGYVAPGDARCGWEPPGAFYRTVRTGGTTAAGDPLTPGFVLVVDTQFLSATTPPVAVNPLAGYDSTPNDPDAVGADEPATSQLGVTVSVFRTDRVNRNPMTTYTQISRRDQLEPLVRSTVEVTAVELGTTTIIPDTPGAVPITLSAGLLDLDATLTHASRVDAVLSGTTTGLATGQQAGGAGTSASAPPSVTEPAQTVGTGQLDASGCDLACWGVTRRSAVAVSAGSGLPNAGSPTSPLQAVVQDDSNNGLTLAGGAGATYLAPRTAPLVRVSGAGVPSGTAGCGVAETGDTVRVAGTGWLRTTAAEDPAAPSVVEACGVARATTLAVLPTAFAPDGVLKVTLDSASVSCAVSGAAHTANATARYSATVEYWTPSGYVVAGQVTHDMDTDTDPLAAVPLTTPLGSFGTLGDYIESWSLLTPSGVRSSTEPGSATASLPGVVDVTTRPARALPDGAPDELSSVTVSLGTLSCEAADRR